MKNEKCEILFLWEIWVSHAKSLTISRVCRCCCCLDDNIVDFHDLFSHVSFSRRKPTTHFGCCCLLVIVCWWLAVGCCCGCGGCFGHRMTFVSPLHIYDVHLLIKNPCKPGSVGLCSSGGILPIPTLSWTGAPTNKMIMQLPPTSIIN